MSVKNLKPAVVTINTSRAPAPVVSRIRGGKLTRIRQRILKRDKYLCQYCLEKGRVTMAEEVDHKTPLHMGGQEIDDNRISTCKTCHNEKSEQEERERR